MAKDESYSYWASTLLPAAPPVNPLVRVRPSQAYEVRQGAKCLMEIIKMCTGEYRESALLPQGLSAQLLFAHHHESTSLLRRA